jgi:hypothetical protein
VQPAIGRAISPEEDRFGGTRVVVLSRSQTISWTNV